MDSSTIVFTKPLSELCSSEEALVNYLVDSIHLVGQNLGFEVEKVEREVRVGPFRADIVVTCKDGSLIVIEAQLGDSNFDHLGKVSPSPPGLTRL